MRPLSFYYFCLIWFLSSYSHANPDTKSITLHLPSNVVLENQELILSHVDDKTHYILVKSAGKDQNKYYSFKYCEYNKEETCEKIGAYDIYTHQQLSKLKSQYLLTARIIFWSESSIVASTAAFTLSALVYYPDLRRYFFPSAKGAKQSTEPLPPPPPQIAQADERCAAPAATSASHAPRLKTVAQSFVPSGILEQTPRQAPELLKPAMQYMGQISTLLAGAAIPMLWGLKDSFMQFLQTSGSLAASFLSPFEHYRAWHLISIFQSNNGNVQFSNKKVASFHEYTYLYGFKDMNELRTKIEDLLACNSLGID